MENIMPEGLGNSELPPAEPVMMERDDSECAPDQSERVDIGLVRLAPPIKGDAKLVSAAGCRQELGFIEPKRLVEQSDRRDRRFADADDADLVRFDEGHRHS